MIRKTFCKTKNSNSRSLVSSNSAGKTFFSRTAFGNSFKILGRPRMNCDFSLGVFAGNASRNLIEETRILSKKFDCWNSRAFIR